MLSVEELNRHLGELDFDVPHMVVEHAASDYVVSRSAIEGLRLRPGGYVPGPVLMALADLTGWLLVFTRAGFTPMALTWDLKINFLRPAHGADLIVTGRQTKFGRLCHATVEIALDGDLERFVAHATTTYVLPAD